MEYLSIGPKGKISVDPKDFFENPEAGILDAIAEANQRELGIQEKVDWLIRSLALWKRTMDETELRSYLSLLRFNLEDPQELEIVGIFFTSAAAIELLFIENRWNNSLIQFGSQIWIGAKTSKELLEYKHEALEDAQKIRETLLQ